MERDEREGVAHELNNCLHVVKNALELLSRQVEPADAEARTHLEMAVRNTERAAALVQRLLEKR